MPKQTFFNLSEEKREKILNTAIDEFAKYYYHKASITRIVNNTGIAKGSFYQYFEDKKDLFKYVIERIGRRKIEYLYPVIKDFDKYDFFDLVRMLYVQGAKFAVENPRFQKIGDYFVKDTDTKLKEEILGENIPKSNEIFIQLIKKGIEKGDINPNIDINLTATIITSLSIEIGEYFVKEMKVKDNTEIMPLIDKMLYILKNGIKNRREDV
ncbi:TetR/AcrR family transcriptional regulator [Maledivibacter halophilus]|uniref:Transcriptional regulator, TetR family n=1 Tax=Maledivibacter halophilus TaxID=36842 RepID=A0A1T5LK46_9FIRM|nr:TetR/AcrR family transcriptional regulator [Maledivibacter halophilus]SKC76367.1 transcriptional regulator, TetR family [Maledivibacter halophilus]